MKKRVYTQLELRAHIMTLLTIGIPGHNISKCRMCAAITEIGHNALSHNPDCACNEAPCVCKPKDHKED